jgi:Ser/Thr protein kinase RdoA (MazF antagonist)
MDSPMDEAAFFGQLVQASYPLGEAAVKLISGGRARDRAIYRVIHPDGSSWLVRAYHQDAEMPDWLIGCAAEDTSAFLRSRAATLLALAPHHFPAPRVILTHGQDTIGMADGWCTLVTSHIPGQTVEASPETLKAMGALLGRLHSLPAPPQTIGSSWLEPDSTIAAALEQYAQVATAAPAPWRELIAALCATLETLAAGPPLPQAITHADCHVQNVICTPDGSYALIDWDGSGRGRPVIDLERLLLYGQFDSATLGNGLERAEQWRVDAILTGYYQFRRLAAEERAVLLEATRFSIAFGSATHAARAAREGWPEAQLGRLVRRRQWYQVCAEISGFAHARLQVLEQASFGADPSGIIAPGS